MNSFRNRTILLIVLIATMSGCEGSFGYPWHFTLKFPETADLGELWLVEDVNCFTCGNGEKYLGHATGTHDIHLPAAHWFVRLKMPKNASALLPNLADPSLSNIGEINLEGSDITDSDLKYLAGINLCSVNLSRTKITGFGLKYLRPNRKWIFVYLHGCDNLDPQYLSHFKGWKLATISLVGYKWGESYSEHEMKVLESARQFICDGQPEDICGTQIR